MPLPWRALARLPWSGRGQKAAEALANAGPRALTRWLSSLWKRNELAELLGGAGTADDRLDFFDQRWAAWCEFPVLERWMLTDMETYLEGDILPKVDRASMAVGLETRSPFLDHLFIKQVLRWPNRADPARGVKAILNKILARYVPEELFFRPKRGFGLPVAQWFRGDLRPLLLKYTSAKRIQHRGLFHPKPIEDAVRLPAQRNPRRNPLAREPS